VDARLVLFGNRPMFLGEILEIVPADRAHLEAAWARGIRGREADDGLPFAAGRRRPEQAADVPGAPGFREYRQRTVDAARDAVRLRRLAAQAFVESPVKDRVGWARIEAAPAALADTELVGDPFVRLELDVDQHRALIHARAKLRGQQVHLE